jgi:copper chaperone CopZ
MSGSKERGDWRITGALAGALVISLCFALPPLGEAIGAIGSRSTALFARWLPYFTVLTFVLLGTGFFVRYWGRRAPLRPLESSPGKRAVGLSRRFLWSATLIVITLSAFPYIYPWGAQKIVRRQAPARTAQRGPSAQLVLKIEGMDCIMCAAGLQNNLRALKGVRSAEVSFQDKKAVIDYDPNSAAVADFEKVIADSGFKVATPAP